MAKEYKKLTKEKEEDEQVFEIKDLIEHVETTTMAQLDEKETYLEEALARVVSLKKELNKL